MDVTLIRNGYNLERRKMYIENPRHNLRSSVELMWQESLENHPNDIQRQKQLNQEVIRENYTRMIDKKLEDELKLNKSSFRVMMAAEREKPPGSSRVYHKNASEYDSLNREMENQDWWKNRTGDESPVEKHKKSQSLSKSVFGYEIDRTAFQKESYLSKILGERLSPYLQKTKNNTIEAGSKHQSFTINHPISLKY